MFDMLHGTVEPETVELLSIARHLQHDLDRHLGARRLPKSWVVEATLDIDVLPSPSIRRHLRSSCRVTITDDRGGKHTSTRYATAPLPARDPIRWIKDWLVRRA